MKIHVCCLLAYFPTQLLNVSLRGNYCTDWLIILCVCVCWIQQTFDKTSFLFMWTYCTDLAIFLFHIVQKMEKIKINIFFLSLWNLLLLLWWVKTITRTSGESYCSSLIMAEIFRGKKKVKFLHMEHFMSSLLVWGKLLMKWIRRCVTIDHTFQSSTVLISYNNVI